MTRPITERMEEARTKMLLNRRAPRVFYLAPSDFDEFATTKPGTVIETFALPLGHKPRPMSCLAFEGVAVRDRPAKPDKSGRIASVLYCRQGTSVTVPRA